MGEKVARKSIELMLNAATTQNDFDIVKYALDDYLEEGYNIQDMVAMYNIAYKKYVSSKQ